MKPNELQIVTFEQAKRLKKAGFDWECDFYYTLEGNSGERFYEAVKRERSPFVLLKEHEIPAPTVALALKWFRDVKRLFTITDIAFNDNGEPFFYAISYGKTYQDWKDGDKSFIDFENAESALLDALLTELEGEQCSAK